VVEKEIFVSFGADVDAVAGWIGSYGGEDSPSDIQRGIFAGEVGVPRLLKLFKKYNLKVSWFWPGHSIETFPKQFQMCVDDGHEIGAHGYTHENPIAMTPEQEEAILSYCVSLIKDKTGKTPRGYVAPWWEMSNVTIDLLLKYGFKYMGEETDLVEIPGNWYLDDLPPMMFMKKVPNSHGWVSPRDIEQLWKDQFDWVYREYDYAVFVFTIHPDVCGRPQNLLMLERIIEYIDKHRGIIWATMEEIAEDFRKRHPRK
jgi:peptidoglycan/xylan/chitin deacetylase (PgdA/CDA1 family)